MRISQKVKGVLNVKSSAYYFHMKTKIIPENYTRGVERNPSNI